MEFPFTMAILDAVGQMLTKGVQFPIITAAFDSLKGANHEVGQDKAVIISFTNMREKCLTGTHSKADHNRPLNISSTYFHFAAWATSGGILYYMLIGTRI